jgi:uncharacterized protein YdhG (YjbR/CyaY superfamily)
MPTRSVSRAKDAGAQVRAYFATLPPSSRRDLTKIRDAIRAAAPRAVEVYSYGIPGFRIDGQPLVWYAAWKSHLSMYPVGEAIVRQVAPKADRYKRAKGTIRFPLDEPPPIALVKQLVKARLAQVRTSARV